METLSFQPSNISGVPKGQAFKPCDEHSLRTLTSNDTDIRICNFSFVQDQGLGADQLTHCDTPRPSQLGLPRLIWCVSFFFSSSFSFNLSFVQAQLQVKQRWRDASRCAKQIDTTWQHVCLRWKQWRVWKRTQMITEHQQIARNTDFYSAKMTWPS